MICTKKGFTLTELLVVVMVIGVLSAVILPKYSKMLETRKTTEAEEILAAVREEQELLCMEKGYYENDLSKLSSLEGLKLIGANARAESTYYTYFTDRDNDHRVMLASNKGEEYVIGITLRDGRIYCRRNVGPGADNDCINLSKDYDSWEDLLNDTVNPLHDDDCKFKSEL